MSQAEAWIIWLFMVATTIVMELLACWCLKLHQRIDKLEARSQAHQNVEDNIVSKIGPVVDEAGNRVEG